MISKLQLVALTHFDQKNIEFLVGTIILWQVNI